ncbi:MAG: apolipoprotein N-acyltransferase, partial [Burkholderiales bacterium]|nr:apolipoprotein N-acyltransferase [Burkholderiales bacterium]
MRLLVVALAGVAQGLALAWPWGVAHADWLVAPSAWLNLWPQPGQPWPALQVVAMAIWIHLLRGAHSARVAMAYGWLFACAGLTATFWWLFISMHTYGGLAAPLAVAAVVALAGVLAVYVAFISWVYWRSSLVGWALDAMFFVSLWALAELARGVWFTGFPWGAVGYAHVNSLGWAAPWVGVYGMGALAVGLSVALAHAWQRMGQGVAGRVLPVFGVLAVLAIGPVLQRTLPGFTQPVGELPLVLLQGNIAQDEKFQPGSGVPRALADYALGFTRQNVGASAHVGLPHRERGTLPSGTLVVAPETALPQLPQQLGIEYWQPVLSLLATQQHAVITGLPLGNPADGYANAVWGITPQQARRAMQRLADG